MFVKLVAVMGTVIDDKLLLMVPIVETGAFCELIFCVVKAQNIQRIIVAFFTVWGFIVFIILFG